jgi:hypothetical protein
VDGRRVLRAGGDARDECREVGVGAFAFHFCFYDEAVDFGSVGVVDA